MRPIFGIATGLLVAVAMVTPAQADSTVVTKSDKRGDVKVYKGKYISKAKKNSIDMDKVSIVHLDNGKYRFKVRLKKIHRSKKWDQMVFFSGRDASADSYTDIGFTTRSSQLSYGYSSVTDANCTLKVRSKGRTVWADVPARCAPTDGQSIKVTTYTGFFRTDANPYSRDTVNLGKFHSD